MPAPPLLDARHIAKAYAGVHALVDASFDLRAGEVHALVGENGAGKSTLVKIVAGAVAADAGEVLLDGVPLSGASPRAARARGIASIYQQPALFPDLTVAENIALGLEQQPAWARVDWAGRRQRAAALLAEVGGRISPEAEAGALSLPQQQLVEIARAVGADARVLILDEPTASLSEDDVRNLFAVVARLRARGVGMIYISHRLDELSVVADRVTVLRDGRTVDTRAMGSVSRETLIGLMVGRELSAVLPKQEVPLGDVALELRGFGSRAAGVLDVTLEVRAGEIVGLAGLVGSGRTELAEALFGLVPADAGTLRVRGRAVRFASAAAAIAAGLAYLPEDRGRHGLVLDMAVDANITLASLGALSPRGVLDRRRETELAVDQVSRLRIKTPATFTPAASLSGGNQQKVALGRWLATKPTVLILDEPTQGVDVSAKAEIHALMGELAGRGVAILMISSDMPEILGMSDRIAVLRGGALVAVLPRAEATQERLLALALGEAGPTAATAGA